MNPFMKIWLFEWLTNRLKQNIHHQPHEQLGEYYIRGGQCHSCGQCCSNVHLAHGGVTIPNPEVLLDIQKTVAEYRYFRPVRQTDAGIFVRCVHLMPNNRCAIYEDRPRFCREYPSEFGLRVGAELAPGCGYSFRPKRSFQNILKQLARRPKV